MPVNPKSPLAAPVVVAALLALAGCEREAVNPPTDPAAPVTPPGEASAVGPTGQAAGVGPAMPSAGPASFVGDWAARPDWCGNTTGAERPIRISTTRIEGYENVCAIQAIDQVNSGYEAALSCEGEGMTSRERVRMAVLGDEMTFTYLGRDGAQVKLTRCATPGAVSREEAPPPS